MKGKIIKNIILVVVVILHCVQGLGINQVQAKTNWGYNQKTMHLERLADDNLEKFTDDFFNQYMKAYQIPGGAIVIIQNGEILFKKGYGYSSLKDKKFFTTNDTYFSIASITKTFTSVAIMKLIQEGEVDINESIQTYLPNLKIDNPYAEKITVQQLLTHSGGIDSSYTEDLSYKALNNNEPHHLLNLLNKRGVKVIHRPGQLVEYSSYGTVILGAIIEEVSGMSC